MYNDVAAWCMRVCALGSIVLSISTWNLLVFKKSAFFDKSIFFLNPFGALLGKDLFGGIAHFVITVLC